MGVLVAHRLRGNQPVAEPRRERFNRFRQRLRFRALDAVGYIAHAISLNLPKPVDRGKGYIRGQGTDRANRDEYEEYQCRRGCDAATGAIYVVGYAHRAAMDPL